MSIEDSAKKLVGLYGARRWFDTVYISTSGCIYLYVKSLKILPKYVREMTQTEEGHKVMVIKTQYASTC